MNDGKIDAIGTHQELIETNAIYREVYDMQTQRGKEDKQMKNKKKPAGALSYAC